MTDRIVLSKMVFEGRHGVTEGELAKAQPFEVDVEIHLDTRPAGLADDLSKTVDYADAFEICRSVVEGPSRRLIEAIAEEIAQKLLARSASSGRARSWFACASRVPRCRADSITPPSRSPAGLERSSR